MNRRKALKLTAILFGGTVIGSDIFLSGCAKEVGRQGMFSESDISFLDQVGETILPETERSPGAKAAKIGLFMKTIVTDCYGEKEQEVFLSGMTSLDTMARTKYSEDFLRLTNHQRHDLLVPLDQGSRDAKDGDPLQFFQMMKQLTIWGYFSSEQGVTKALRYNPIPGEYKGCVPYTHEDKAWA